MNRIAVAKALGTNHEKSRAIFNLQAAYRAVRRLQVENGSGFLVIRAEGFRDRDPVHSKLSAARRLLEFVFQRSVHVLAPGTQMMVPRIVRPAARSDAA